MADAIMLKKPLPENVYVVTPESDTKTLEFESEQYVNPTICCFGNASADPSLCVVSCLTYSSAYPSDGRVYNFRNNGTYPGNFYLGINDRFKYVYENGKSKLITNIEWGGIDVKFQAGVKYYIMIASQIS